MPCLHHGMTDTCLGIMLNDNNKVLVSLQFWLIKWRVTSLSFSYLGRFWAFWYFISFFSTDPSKDICKTINCSTLRVFYYCGIDLFVCLCKNLTLYMMQLSIVEEENSEFDSSSKADNMMNKHPIGFSKWYVWGIYFLIYFYGGSEYTTWEHNDFSN